MTTATPSPATPFPGLSLPSAERGPNAEFWASLRRHELRVQRCCDCALTRTPGEEICHACHSTRSEWIEVPTTGTVYSWTRVWHAANEQLVDMTPYVLVWVEIDHVDRPRFLGNLVGDPRDDIEIGDRVRGVFEDFADGTVLNWEQV